MPLEFLQKDVLGQLVEWAEGHPLIRALILTSTRAQPGAGVDVLSDHDVILAVTDADEFATDDAWQSGYGTPAARWGDEHKVFGLKTFFRGVVYEDGAKIDYMIWPDSLLDRISTAERLPDGLDVGYRILVDKDRRTSGWAAPTYRAHIPTRPSEAGYRALVEEFWWSSTYVAKALWREEIVFAKFVLDADIRHGALRRLLEWRIELDCDWSWKPGAYGRGLESALPANLWNELAATFTGVGMEENWRAVFATAELFRRVAIEVGDALGYAYPGAVDEVISAHLQAVQALPRPD